MLEIIITISNLVTTTTIIITITKKSLWRRSVSLGPNLMSWAQIPSQVLTLPRGKTFTFSQEWRPYCLHSLLENSSPERLMAWRQWYLQDTELIGKAPWNCWKPKRSYPWCWSCEVHTDFALSTLQHTISFATGNLIKKKKKAPSFKTLPELW